MIVETMLSRTFKSLKPHSDVLKNLSTKSYPKPPKSSSITSPILSKSSTSKSTLEADKQSSSSRSSRWSVYLIVSTNPPIKTYVGVTTNFSRRLKQHNGELKGGAKASRAGRPWVCACLIRGFNNRSEACEFESRWKIFSRKLPRKKKNKEVEKQTNDGLLPLLQHRHEALTRVKGVVDCSHLEIDWHFELY